MIEILKEYNTQFRFEPVIQNDYLLLKNFKHIILCGMGGSHLPAGILKTISPGVDIYVHRSYDLPPFEREFIEDSILVASSYSGNTEEVISFYKKAKQLYDLPILCITTGGELLSLAITNNDPYIVLPQSKFVPRTALGFSTIALSAVLRDKNIIHSLQNIELDINSIEKESQKYVDMLLDKTPVFYASEANLQLIYNWKIKTNETAKKHAFYNVFPEANHNELEGYEYLTKDTDLLPVIFKDTSDDERIKKRFTIFEAILKEKNIQYTIIDISNQDIYQKVFNTIVLGDFVTAQIAQKNDREPSTVPLIESFKKRLI